jgi:hypothetical protein
MCSLIDRIHNVGCVCNLRRVGLGGRYSLLGDFASKAMYHAFTVVDDAVHAEFGRGWQRLQRPSSAATTGWLSRIQGNASSARKDFLTALQAGGESRQ